MTLTLYRIADWDEHFENNRTRDLKSMAWVPLPNRQDGDGYTELLDHPDGPSHFGAWVALVQVASKCRPRGTLMRDGGTPHDSSSLARMTRFPRDVIAAAIERLVAIGWMTAETIEPKGQTEIPQQGAAKPQDDATIPHDGDASRARAHACAERNRTEGTEGKERNGREQPHAALTAGEGEAETERSKILAVFAAYREFHPRAHPKPLPTSKEWRQIKARLAEGYTVDDLKDAIRGCHKSPFHAGENDRGKAFQSLELIVRDASHVQSFIELASAPDGPVLSEKTRRGQRAAQNFIRRMGGPADGSP